MRFKKADKIKRPANPISIKGINMETRTITAPEELQSRFSKNKKANAFFDTLSFTNKKEYIVWITSAKKDETKKARLDATIEKLSLGKRNPSDK